MRCKDRGGEEGDTRGGGREEGEKEVELWKSHLLQTRQVDLFCSERSEEDKGGERGRDRGGRRGRNK